MKDDMVNSYLLATIQAALKLALVILVKNNEFPLSSGAIV